MNDVPTIRGIQGPLGGRVNRKEREMTVEVNPADVWEQLVRASMLRVEALHTGIALARRVGEDDLEVRVSQRTLMAAVAEKRGQCEDDGGMARKFVRLGLKTLIAEGWVQHLNPNAPRRDAGHYRLTLPMTHWPQGLIDASLVAAA